jgi:membrane associated rhomboid family serine protease
MLEQLGSQMDHLIVAMQNNLIFSLKLIALLWAIHIINKIAQYRLNVLGILPRRFRGLFGIPFSPFLHGDFNHLFFNSIPLFVLADLVLIEGKVVFYYVSVTIIIVSGFLTWLMGKRGIHIVASGLIMGFFGYLLSKAYFSISATTIILAGFCIYYFGGLFLALFPGAKKNISWEGHIFGFAAGIATAYWLPKIIWFVGIK